MRVAIFLNLYVLVIGQNWRHYSAALIIYVYDNQGGRLMTPL